MLKKSKKADFKDVWEELKGDERKFTYYSAVHKSYSIIDYGQNP